jgi:Na+-transporting NADH:ubiquinone oxidoreductase subunit F
MIEIVIAIAICCAITVSLTLIILLAEVTIGNYGECTISINDGARELKIDGGQTLLACLNEAEIYIPSACGGKGSCGLCTLQVTKGAGDYLPTELPWISEERRKENYRLACQIKVKNDLEIIIPESCFLVREVTAEVVAITDLTHDIKEVRLKLPVDSDIVFKAGQFMQIKTPKYKLCDEPVYRAYSISSSPDDETGLEFMIRLVPNGICTTYVHEFLNVGDMVTVNGAHGEFFLQDSERDIICIAGGSGMAPIMSILLDMRYRGIKRKVTYFFGAITPRDLFYLDELKQLEKDLDDFTFIPALSQPKPEDNWQGETGLITEVIERNMTDGSNSEAYLCGSPGMINACVNVLTGKKVPEDQIFYDKFG